MQGEASDEANESTVGASEAGEHRTSDGKSGDNGLTPDEWAELERLTDPMVQDEPQQTPPSATPDQETPAVAAEAPIDQATEVPTNEVLPNDAVADAGANAGSSDTTPSSAADDLDRADGVTDSPVSGAVATSPAVDLEHDAVDDQFDDAPVGAVDQSDAAVAADGQADAPEGAPRMPLPRVIAVANQKGGVGKTTTTVNIAACLAEQGYRTLLVDLDPQANASTGVGIDSRQLDHSIYDVMLHDQPADSVIEPTEVKNLFVLPSSLDLAGAEIELVAMLSREHRLRLAIESVLDDYDYVLIDCPPSLGLLTINALTAAREVLVPIQCEYYALEGLGQLMRNVELVRASLNPGLQISHIVLVMFDPRTKLAGQVVDEVRTHFGATVCENVIPRTVRLSEAPSFGQPITTFDSGSRGAAAYRAVTQEVLGGQT